MANSEPPLEARPFRRGRGGRPTREEAERRHRKLLSVAFRLFLEKGSDGASIDEIARQSGVAKTFIYGRYADKSALLMGALEHLMADVIGTLQITQPLPLDVEEGLFAFGSKLLDIALQPEAIAFHRQFLAEAGRFPDLARLLVDRNPLLAIIVEVLTTYVKRGDLVLDDSRLAAEHFAILAIGIPRTLAMLIGRETPPEEQRRLRAAVRLFLDGCRSRP